MTQKTNNHLRRLVLSAVLLALGLVLPFLTGQIPEIGSMLSPLHIPVLICGFVCGWHYGLAVGAILPIMRSLIFTMPPMMAAIPMAFEMAVYGLLTGLMYRFLPKKMPYLYVSLVTAMLAGRVVWGLARYVIAGLNNTTFTFSAFLAGAFTEAIPGIICHLILVPMVVIALRKAKLMPNV